MEQANRDGFSRRRLIQSGALAAAALWVPVYRIDRASADARCAPPAGFPSGIGLYQQAFENWAKTIEVEDLWTCAPRSGKEVAQIANWARHHGYRLRPRGSMHGWSPLTVEADGSCSDRVVLVDTKPHLSRMELLSGHPPVVRVGAGAEIEALLGFLEQHGLGLVGGVPSVGAPTVGGLLAIGGHGATLPGRGEHRPAGATYGSLSNLVVSLRAVVWDGHRRRYVLRTFHRGDPECHAVLVNLGRTFVTRVDLRTSALQKLRCVSYTDIPATELFAAPGSTGRTFESFLDDTGRAESIWYAFTEKPWLKVWSVSPRKPVGSRAVTTPYNYAFSDNLPEPLTDLIDQIVHGSGALTPAFGQGVYATTVAGLDAGQARDIWGPAKNTQLYVKPTTLRLDDSGWAILTRRSNVQRALHSFTDFYARRIADYQAKGAYPINGALQLRVSGLDRPGHVGLRGARAPALSPTAPVRGRDDWNAAIWLNVLTFPDTPRAHAFYRDVERFILHSFRGDYAVARPEWSKIWAFSETASHVAPEVLDKRIPHAFTRGRPPSADWAFARRTLRRLDPHNVFSNGFLDRLL